MNKPIKMLKYAMCHFYCAQCNISFINCLHRQMALIVELKNNTGALTFGKNCDALNNYLHRTILLDRWVDRWSRQECRQAGRNILPLKLTGLRTLFGCLIHLSSLCGLSATTHFLCINQLEAI